MDDYLDDVRAWLRSRPLQDDPRWTTSGLVEKTIDWDEWLKKGDEIPDLENYLIRILANDQDPVNRAAAAIALGFTGKASSVKPLTVALETDRAMVAMEAAASLGRLNSEEAIKPLCAALQNSDANVRANACTALGEFSSPEALACLKNAETDPDPLVHSALEKAMNKHSQK